MTYHRFYQARTPRQKRQTPTPAKFASVVSAEVLWAAAVVADRINNGDYIKHDELSEDGAQVIRRSNRDIIRDILNANGPEITSLDFEIGRNAREWHSKNLVIKSLRGDLSEFEHALNNAVNLEEFYNSINKFEVAVVASQIRSYHIGIKEEAVREDVDRTPLAAVGTKVQIIADVVKTVFSRNYGVHFITAKTTDRKMIFFSFREKLQGTITAVGTVKAHRADATQLNRVRLV
jgi:hypothetical protein